jgi:hypothetical protein
MMRLFFEGCGCSGQSDVAVVVGVTCRRRASLTRMPLVSDRHSLRYGLSPDPPIHRCYPTPRAHGFLGVNNARQASSLPSTLSSCHHTYLAPLATRAISGSGLHSACIGIWISDPAGSPFGMSLRLGEGGYVGGLPLSTPTTPQHY